MNTDLIVVIPTAGSGDIESTLASLLECNRPDCFAKIVVVENGRKESGNVEQIVSYANETFPVEYFYVSQANKSYALNQFMAKLDQNCLLYLTDDDIQFDSNVLVEFAKAATGKKEKTIFGGSLKVKSEGEPPADLVGHLPSSMVGFPKPNEELDMERVLFLGANWAAYSDDLKQLGGFDPRFGPGSPIGATGQESQMMRTMRNAGFDFCFVPKAVVWHHVELDRLTIDFMRKRRFRNGIEAGQRHRINSEDNPLSLGAKIPLFCRHFFRVLLLPVLVPIMKVLGFNKDKVYQLTMTSNFCRGFLKGWLNKTEFKANEADQNAQA